MEDLEPVSRSMIFGATTRFAHRCSSSLSYLCLKGAHGGGEGGGGHGVMLCWVYLSLGSVCGRVVVSGVCWFRVRDIHQNL